MTKLFAYALLFQKEQGAVRRCLFYLLFVMLVCQMYNSIREKKTKQKLGNYGKMIALFKVCSETFAF